MVNKIPTICRFCGKQCHVLVEVDEKGQVEKIYPDKKYKTVWCMTGKNALNFMNHPDRVRTSLERVGERGEGKWQTISWEEAFEKIGCNFRRIIEENGQNSFLGIRGFNKPYFNAIYERWMNHIGSVNSMGAANMCHFPSMSAARETFGFFPECKITEATKFLVLWGSNPYNTDKKRAAQIVNARKKGMKIIVIDPCYTKHAEDADFWMSIIPGKDMALALGMIRLIIENNWFDKEYIQTCTYGFDELKEHVKEYSLEKTEQVTGIKADIIKKVTKMIALEGPGLIEIGNAMDHNADSFQKCRAINILIGITGNVDKDGALNSGMPMSKRQIEQRKIIACPQISPYNERKNREKIIGYQNSYVDIFNESSGQKLAEAMNSGKPYPIKACYVQGGNPAMIWENREELVKAFLKLDFMVVSDFFITPTAMLADIVLPAAMYMEYESIYVDGNDILYYCPQLVKNDWGKSDLEITNEIAKSMGYRDEFWDTMDDYWNTFLSPFCVDLERLRSEKVIKCSDKDNCKREYGKYLKKGFPTPSGKIQFYSDSMRKKGNNPIPVFYDYAKTTSKYPYFATNYKSQYYYHTAGRQVKVLRKKEPEAIAFISSDIASKCGIKTGEYVRVTTDVGCVIQKASVAEKMTKKTVALAHGWWYPEKEKNPFILSACSNNIVDDKRMIGKEIPSFTTRGVPCNVEKYNSYEKMYPQKKEKEYDVKIEMNARDAYMDVLEELESKGFMKGKPNLILKENQEVEKILPQLKQNGYKVTVFSEGIKECSKEYSYCSSIYFRIYGFSQKIYDRVNQYDWNKIKRNIEKSINILKETVLCKIEYIMYPFNFCELHVARKWAEDLGIELVLKYGSFDDSLKLKYASDEMSTKEMIVYSKKYFFTNYSKIEEEKEKLCEHFAGAESIRIDSNKNLIFEWDVTGKGQALDDVKDYCEWRKNNCEIYEKYSLRQAVTLWWLWKRTENECL